jgi:hypothetical protein
VVVTGVPPVLIRENPLFDFKNLIGEDTGELGTYVQARYNGLKCRIYDPTEANPDGRITIEGSLHKYLNNGEHNYNDFGLSGLHWVLNDIEEKFGIAPEMMVFKQLELGVNLELNKNPDDILRNMILHKTDRINSPIPGHKGKYYHVQRSQKIYKLYDKSRHMKNLGKKAPTNLFRMENKYTKMEEFHRQNIHTLADLLSTNLPELVQKTLLKEWEGVLYFDEKILENHPNKDNYGNIRYWEKLISKHYENFKYHRSQLNRIYENSPLCDKSTIKRKIIEKTRMLNDYPTEIDTLSIRAI